MPRMWHAGLGPHALGSNELAVAKKRKRKTRREVSPKRRAFACAG